MKAVRRLSTNWFNAICLIVSTLWLGISVPVGIVARPTIPDFEQFYMAGVMVRHGHWDALYPIPKLKSLDNPGLRIHSDAKPKWKRLSHELGVWDHTHFMLPPPSALLFVPLSWLSYRQAFWVWTLIETLCVWGTALIASRLLRRLLERESRAEGLLTLLIAFSPMSARAIRIANVSPLIALAIALVLLGLIEERRSICTASALIGGALFKYATLVLAPLLVAMRRWNLIFHFVSLAAAAICATFALSGAGPFVEFYATILPTLSRPSAFLGNQSLPGMLARVLGRPLPFWAAVGLNTARLFSLGSILWLVASTDRSRWRGPLQILAGSGLLISWLLVFSPIAWEHWPIFLCPVWGWLVWEAMHKGAPRAVAVTSLALMVVPAGIFKVRGFLEMPLTLPEPLNSTQLFGVALVGGLAYWRLLRPPTSPHRAESARP